MATHLGLQSTSEHLRVEGTRGSIVQRSTRLWYFAHLPAHLWQFSIGEYLPSSVPDVLLMKALP